MTEKQSLVERVARAMVERPRKDGRHSRNAPAWDELSEGDLTYHMLNAKAALLAILPPELRELSRKGTAGPWWQTGAPGPSLSINSNPHNIAHCYFVNGKANAALIAAAVNFIREIEEGRDD